MPDTNLPPVTISGLPQANEARVDDQIEVNQLGASRSIKVGQLVTALAPLIPPGPTGPAGPVGPAGSISFVQDGTGAVTRTVSDKLKEIVSVLDFGGVMGGPATANTTALQAAVATGKMVHIPSGTFTINPTAFTATVRLIGEGNTSILQWAPGVAAGSLILVTGVGSAVELRDLTIDGSFQSFPVAAGYHASINFVPTASGARARISVHNCTFINGREWDVRVQGSLTPNAWVKAEFVGCRFRDGVEGQAGTSANCIGCSQDVDLLITGCTFDGPIANGIGRVGLCYQQVDKQVSQQQGSVVVSGNTFRNMGFAYGDENVGSLGSCDVYSGASQVSITGNRIINPYGRGICVKGDASDIAVTGNVVSGLKGGEFAAMCIVVFSSQAKGTAGSRCVIADNTCKADDGAGIWVDGADYATDPNLPAYKDVVISGNAITVPTGGPAPYEQGIYARNCIGVKIAGNVIRGGTNAISVVNCSETITVEDNDVRGCLTHALVFTGAVAPTDLVILNNVVQTGGGYGINSTVVNSFQVKGNTIKGCASGAIVFATAPAKMSAVQGNTCIDNGFNYTLPNSANVIEEDNIWSPGPGFTARVITILAGVATIIGQLHYVDTEAASAADDLTTLNGGRDNMIVVLYPANAARVVTVKDGGNLILNGDYVMSAGNMNITLQKNGASWTELSRSNNQALGVVQTSLGADVLLNNTANYFNGPSVALTSGTWMISANFVVSQTTVGPDAYLAHIYNGTSVVSAEPRVVSTDIGENTAGSCFAAVTLAAATTMTLRAKDTTSVNGKLLATGTSIVAVKAG